ncbi:hypothetical protein [Caulobacter sp. DWR1-3-2b1]|uniref:hypothetical protein n=1 Tax=Caulobacter sp. DWR1-3-2b1 TaxID=2804670 RepID=UPI003CEE6237
MTLRGRFVVLATGVIDRKPDLENIDMAIRAARVRICPICDAYEAIDQQIAVLGDGDLGAREATFLTTYSSRVTLLHLGPASSLSDPCALRTRGVEVLPVDLSDVSVGLGPVQVTPPGQEARSFDCLYLALGCEMQSRLAVAWGADHAPRATSSSTVTSKPLSTDSMPPETSSEASTRSPSPLPKRPSPRPTFTNVFALRSMRPLGNGRLDYRQNRCAGVGFADTKTAAHRAAVEVLDCRRTKAGLLRT